MVTEPALTSTVHGPATVTAGRPSVAQAPLLADSKRAVKTKLNVLVFNVWEPVTGCLRGRVKHKIAGGAFFRFL
jgi:hypothetical protein